MASYLWEVKSDDTGRNDRIRTSNSSLRFDNLSGFDARRTFNGRSRSASSCRGLFMTRKCVVATASVPGNNVGSGIDRVAAAWLRVPLARSRCCRLAPDILNQIRWNALFDCSTFLSEHEQTMSMPDFTEWVEKNRGLWSRVYDEVIAPDFEKEWKKSTGQHAYHAFLWLKTC